jgi:non-ribosomal peptide synthetase component F
MFNTGDLACWQANGCVQMLGRGDSQVKVKVRQLSTEANDLTFEGIPHRT